MKTIYNAVKSLALKRLTLNSIVAAIVFSSVLVSSHAQFGGAEPEISVSKVAVTGVATNSLTLEVSLVVNNTSNQEVPLKAVRYSLLARGEKISADTWEANTSLVKGVNNLKMPLTVDTTKVMAIAPDALLTGRLPYELSGWIILEDMPLHFPFERKGEINLLDLKTK